MKHGNPKPRACVSGKAARRRRACCLSSQWIGWQRMACQSPIALFSRYTKTVSRNVTIRISDEAILWVRRQAAEQNSSVSRLVGEMLERQMRLTDEYWLAFDHWKSNRPLAAAGAAERLSREDVHERR